MSEMLLANALAEHIPPSTGAGTCPGKTPVPGIELDQTASSRSEC
jgi:hypothetical protein